MAKKRLNKSRRNFLKQGITGVAGITFLPSVLQSNHQNYSVDSKKNIKFIYRTLGKTGIRLPVVNMGVMNADNPKLVEAALDAGIILLDTAHVYQGGRNEEMIGTVIKGRPRDSYLIATKVHENRDRTTGLFPPDAKSESFIEKFEISLKRLGVAHVDILYLHSISKKESLMFEPYVRALQKIKKEGKTRFIGVTTHMNEPEVIRAAADSRIYDVVLTAYNFRQPHVAEVKNAIAYAAKSGMGIVAMKTQAGAYWDRERLNPINMKAALKWALNDANVHTAIPGFTTFDQMQLDISVMADLALTADEKNDLKIGEKLGFSGLYCAQCGKCLSQCPHHLEIPTVMRSFMYAYGYRNLSLAQHTLNSAHIHSLPCTDCRTCSVSCSQGFDLKSRLQDIVRIRHIPSEFLG